MTLTYTKLQTLQANVAVELESPRLFSAHNQEVEHAEGGRRFAIHGAPYQGQIQIVQEHSSPELRMPGAHFQATVTVNQKRDLERDRNDSKFKQVKCECGRPKVLEENNRLLEEKLLEEKDKLLQERVKLSEEFNKMFLECSRVLRKGSKALRKENNLLRQELNQGYGEDREETVHTRI